jgi:membrane protease subunit HflK
MTRLFIGAAVAALVVWTVLSALTQVQPGERAVVRRFGRILADKPGPGLFVGLPWGFDRVERVPVRRVKRVVVGMVSEESDQGAPQGQLLTGDHNVIDVQAEIFFTVFEDQVEKYVLQSDRADALVARVTEAVLAEWIAGRTVDEVLLRGKTLLPAYLVAQVQNRLQDAGYDLGIKIEEASINRLNPPEEVKDAFDRLAQAQTTVRTQVYKAEQSADSKKREAEAKVFQIQRGAVAYAQEQRLQAQADAETFLKRLEQYRKLLARDPDYLNALWQDEITRLYARMRETGRIDVLDHYLSGEGLNITQFPLLPKKK